MDAVEFLRHRIFECEAAGISVLCCPEAMLGGLADWSANPARFAFRGDDPRLASILAPLASPTVTLIVGFTELTRDGRLHNSAAIVEQGKITGIYRKNYPAMRQSIYSPGAETPVFRAGALTFGVLICNDSNYPELARNVAAQRATVLFVPTNNSLPLDRDATRIRLAARRVDVSLATGNRFWVVRADVAGQNGKLASAGCSEIVDPRGAVVVEAKPGQPDLLVANIDAVR